MLISLLTGALSAVDTATGGSGTAAGGGSIFPLPSTITPLSLTRLSVKPRPLVAQNPAEQYPTARLMGNLLWLDIDVEYVATADGRTTLEAWRKYATPSWMVDVGIGNFLFRAASPPEHGYLSRAGFSNSKIKLEGRQVAAVVCSGYTTVWPATLPCPRSDSIVIQPVDDSIQQHYSSGRSRRIRRKQGAIYALEAKLSNIRPDLFTLWLTWWRCGIGFGSLPFTAAWEDSLPGTKIMLTDVWSADYDGAMWSISFKGVAY